MRTVFAGVEPAIDGWRDALDGGPCPTPNLFVTMNHWDDFEARAYLMKKARERGIDLILLRLEEDGAPNTVTAAGLPVSIHAVMALNGRFTARQCMPWVADGKLTFLIPVDEGYDECFVMGDEGQFVGSDGSPKGEAFEAGLAAAKQRIEECIQLRFHWHEAKANAAAKPDRSAKGRGPFRKRGVKK